MKLKKEIITILTFLSIEPIIKKLHIDFNDDYLTSLLKKYYHSK